MNEWPAAIWAAISAMTAALVLSFIVVLGHLASDSARVQQEDDNAVAIIKEYRKYNQFDVDTTTGIGLFPQDVVSAIAESRGVPEIWVDTLPGAGVSFGMKWNAATPAANFSTIYLNSLIDPSSLPTTTRFDSKVVKDLNGAITSIEFRRR